VRNQAGAGPTSGTVTMTETVPAGLTLTGMSGTGWNCPSGGITCTTTAVLAGGSSYPAITMTVNVAANAPASVNEQVSASGGGALNTPSASDGTTISSSGGGGGSGSTASFVKADSSTQGNWKGMYGADGAAIAADETAYPAYALVTMAGQTPYTWAASTSDVRALEQSAGSSRVAATWFSMSSYTIDVNLTDGNSHQVSLYCLDWDYNWRKEQIQITDAASGTVLDTQVVSSFQGGQYLVWSLKGHVKITVTPMAGNAVVSGVFFN